MKVLPEHRRVFEHPPLRRPEAVQPRRDQRVQGLGHLERADLRGRDVAVPVGAHEPAVEQHPDGLDRVQRDAFGAVSHPVAQLLGQARDETCEQRVHRLGAERLQRQRGEVTLRARPRRMLLGQLGPRQREHEEWMAARPVQQVADEVEQRRVGPLQVLEDEHRRAALGQALEEQPPRGEEVVTVEGGLLGDPEQLCQPFLDPAALVGVGQLVLERLPQLGRSFAGVLLLADPGAHAHHLGERPVRHAVAVGQAAATVPEDVVDEPVDVALELRREPRLPDPGDADDRDEPRPALVARGVEEVLHQPELALAPDERRLEPGRAPFAAARGDHALGPPERHGLGLPFERVLARVVEGHRGLARPPSPLADEHGARLGGVLHARGRVHEVAGNHAFSLGADRHRRVAGDDADAHRQLRRPDLAAERADDLDELQPRAHRPLGVVLARYGRAPDRHHRVADELLDRPAVAVDHSPRGLEVARKQLAHLLGVAVLRERREADQVAEEDRHQSPLGLGGGGRAEGLLERGPALAAEAVVGLVRGPTGRAGQGQRRAAAGAELASGAVLGSAG